MDTALPPRHLNISGDGPFRSLGENNVQLCRELAGQRHDEKVLDVGCGIGRTALALTSFLSADARYVGFDIVEFAIRWCRQNITQQFPNFSFVHADVFNYVYNHKGAIRAEEYEFPFERGQFTFALATSLFTHVKPAVAEQYIRQTHRVLTPGARFLSSWFLLDGEQGRRQSEANVALLEFPVQLEHQALRSAYAPEQAIAFDRRYVEKMFSEAGFVTETIARGGWSGLDPTINSSQDRVTARKI